MLARDTAVRWFTAVHAMMRAVGMFVGPQLERATIATARALAGLGHLFAQHRAELRRLGLHGGWWTALWMLAIGAPSVVGTGAVPDRATMMTPFVVGLLLCAVVRLMADDRPLRGAAFGLGALHGIALTLAWTAWGS